MKRYDLYGVGAALLDTEFMVSEQEFQELGVKKGWMTLIDETRRSELITGLKSKAKKAHRACGGSVANSIIANCHFGGSAFFSCSVADDEDGRFYLKDLSQTGVDFPPTVKNARQATGSCLVLITPDAERSMNTFLGASAELGPMALDEAAIKNSRYLYLEGYLSANASNMRAALAACKIARRQNTCIALSMSDPGIVNNARKELEKIIDIGVDILFCNEEEALTWTNSQSLEQTSKELTKISKLCLITIGARGVLICNQEGMHLIEAPKIRAVDTNGAGDMFAGAFLNAICRGLSPKEAARFAVRAAAKIVTCYGPRLANREDYQLLLKP